MHNAQLYLRRVGALGFFSDLALGQVRKTSAKKVDLPLKRSSHSRCMRKNGRCVGYFVKNTNNINNLIKIGGRYRVRTCDPYHVKVVLYH
jgi:hypothetical protein